MCGISAIHAWHPAAPPVQRAELAAINAHMASRGPDGEGLWLSDSARTALAHRRLSIIDLSPEAAQPMLSLDGQQVLSFNGEIYNYRELRRDLIAQGCSFRTESDSEVLLQLYALKQERMVEDLQGMFAFVLWDAARGTLLLARDAMGIKPLYYAEEGGTIRVASQVNALLAGGCIPAAADPAGVAGFWLSGSVPEPFTTVAAIKALPAGCTLCVTAAGPGPVQRWFSVAAAWAAAERQPVAATQALAHIRRAVQQSVARHLVSDVPVALFLSAGIDSSALLGVIHDVAPGLPVHTITLAFAEYAGSADDEAPLAAAVARHYGYPHSVRCVDQAEFRRDLPALLAAMDQPSIDGINAWFVSKACRELGIKVAISGLGGDELFGGYPSFRDIPRWNRWLHWPTRVPGLASVYEWVLDRSAALFSGARCSPKLRGLLRYGGSVSGAWLLRRGLFMPWEDCFRQAVAADPASAGSYPLQWIAQALADGPRSAFASIATLEASLYMRNQLLRDADWAGMAHGVEIRVPLVDATLLREVAPVLAGSGQYRCKQWLADCPLNPLPAAVVQRAKTGFTTPIRQWLQQLSAEAGVQPAGNAQNPVRAQAEHWSRSWARQVATVFGIAA